MAPWIERTHAAWLASIWLLMAIPACGDRTPDAPTGGTLIIAVPSAWSPGPPPMVTDLLGRVVSDQLYERLADIGPHLNTIGDLGFAPRLASRWTWATDSLSVAFTLDARARWHDGRPVRAADVKFTFDVTKDPRTGSSITPLLAGMDSVSVRDSLTAVVWFRRRTPTQFYDFVYQLPIMPEHIWRDVPRDRLVQAEAARAPVGSGRFRFGRFEPGVRLELVADTSHNRGRARLDRVVWSLVPDGSAAVAQLLTGQVDMFETLPPDVVPRVDSAATLRTLKYDGLQFTYLGFNARDPRRRGAPHPVLADRNVRRALSMAMDRAAMLGNVFGALGTMGSGPFPRALADTTIVLPPFDRSHAAALLDSAGWAVGTDGVRHRRGRPLALSLIVPASSRPRMRYAVLIQEQVKAVGARIDIESMDFAAFFDRQASGRFDAALMATGYDPSPTSIQQSWSTAGIGPGGQNFLAYSNPVFDALLDSAMTTFDAAAARARAHRAYQVLVDDAPAVWLYDVLTVAGLHSRVRPEGLRADGWWVNLADWWIPAGERIERDRVGLRAATP